MSEIKLEPGWLSPVLESARRQASALAVKHFDLDGHMTMVRPILDYGAQVRNIAKDIDDPDQRAAFVERAASRLRMIVEHALREATT